MKASRFTAEQIVAILQEADAGAQVPELCRRHGTTETTFYRSALNEMFEFGLWPSVP